MNRSKFARAARTESSKALAAPPSTPGLSPIKVSAAPQKDIELAARFPGLETDRAQRIERLETSIEHGALLLSEPGELALAVGDHPDAGDERSEAERLKAVAAVLKVLMTLVLLLMLLVLVLLLVLLPMLTRWRRCCRSRRRGSRTPTASALMG